MSKLGQVVESVENYNKFVLDQVKRARTDDKFGRDLLGRWNDIKAKIPYTHTPTGIKLPRLALPEVDEPGEVARFLFGEGLPGEFPYLNGAYREMYLAPLREIEAGSYGNRKSPTGDYYNGARRVSCARIQERWDWPPQQEEPTCLFSRLTRAQDH